MSDKELLELAAKAAGIKTESGFFWCKDTGSAWNPLTDDGDALRLAVALLLEVNPTIADKPTVSVYGNNKGRMVAAHEPRKPCILAATRRAIVRAAAEIGRET